MSMASQSQLTYQDSQDNTARHASVMPGAHNEEKQKIGEEHKKS